MQGAIFITENTTTNMPTYLA